MGADNVISRRLPPLCLSDCSPAYPLRCACELRVCARRSLARFQYQNSVTLRGSKM